MTRTLSPITAYNMFPRRRWTDTKLAPVLDDQSEGWWWQRPVLPAKDGTGWVLAPLQDQLQMSPTLNPTALLQTSCKQIKQPVHLQPAQNGDHLQKQVINTFIVVSIKTERPCSSKSLRLTAVAGRPVASNVASVACTVASPEHSKVPDKHWNL